MKKIKFFIGLGLTLLTSSLLTNPVKANIVPKTISNFAEKVNRNFQKNLISQLRGHEVYNGASQMEWGDLLLGRVVGKSGNILFVKLSDGSHFNAVGEGYPGGNVLVEKTDKGYHITGMAHSSWISILESKYGWKKITAISSLNERTAALWQQLESSRTSSVVTSPVKTYTPNYTPVEQQTINEPVRGLY